MRISKAEYQSKLDAIEALERETKRLAKLISEKTTNCRMGAWCKDCVHLGHDHSSVSWYTLMETHRDEYGRVTYCKKHLHEVCPEFELKG